MFIETLHRNWNTRQLEPLGRVFIDARHGWKTPADYVRECSRRFKRRDPKPYRNGLEMRGDVGTLQRIWFED